MCHFVGVVEFVGDGFAVYDGDVGVLGVGFVDEGYCCFVVLCCHFGIVGRSSRKFFLDV